MMDKWLMAVGWMVDGWRMKDRLIINDWWMNEWMNEGLMMDERWIVALWMINEW
jgi:hypothetical protein